MSKLSNEEIKNYKKTVSDKGLPIETRKAAYDAIRDGIMNPYPTFDPATFDIDIVFDDYEVKKRNREEPPNRMPTMGLLPKKIMEGQMIGRYENPQDLYLLLAYYVNKISDRLDAIEVEINKLKLK